VNHITKTHWESHPEPLNEESRALLCPSVKEAILSVLKESKEAIVDTGGVNSAFDWWIWRNQKKKRIRKSVKIKFERLVAKTMKGANSQVKSLRP